MQDNTNKEVKYNINLLRGWQTSQLKILKEFASKDKVILSQTILSGASGYPAGSNAVGGSITPLSRAKLIVKAGRDENGQRWQLNEERVDLEELRKLLDSLNI